MAWLRREATVVSGDCVFRPVGDVDLAVAGRPRSEWYAVIDGRLPARVIVDLQDVTFMDSSGLSLLAGLAKRQQPRGGRVAVCNASSQIANIMTISGLNRSVKIPLLAVQAMINSRPRKVLAWKTPAEILDQQLRSFHQARVATTG
jgi:anti-anti-sigma factor